MRRSRTWGGLFALLLALGVLVAGCGGGDDEGGDEAAEGGAKAAEPIVIGAAVDQTKLMRFFDGPALTAAQIQAAIERHRAEAGQWPAKSPLLP